MKKLLLKLIFLAPATALAFESIDLSPRTPEAFKEYPTALYSAKNPAGIEHKFYGHIGYQRTPAGLKPGHVVHFHPLANPRVDLDPYLKSLKYDKSPVDLALLDMTGWGDMTLNDEILDKYYDKRFFARQELNTKLKYTNRHLKINQVNRQLLISLCINAIIFEKQNDLELAHIYTLKAKPYKEKQIKFAPFRYTCIHTEGRWMIYDLEELVASKNQLPYSSEFAHDFAKEIERLLKKEPPQITITSISTADARPPLAPQKCID